MSPPGGRRLRVGMVGGGLDSVIGQPHMIAQRVAGCFELVAGAFSIDPEISRATGRSELIDADRAYASYEEMLEGERNRDDRIDLVVVASPPSSHEPIAEAFLEAGIDVLCEKPLTATLSEAESLARTVEGSGRLFALGYYFAGYPAILHARELARSGALGEIRMVDATFAPGAPPFELELPREQRHWRWKDDEMGAVAILGEVGTHAQQMLEFVTGQRVSTVSAQLGTVEKRREVFDNAYLSVRLGESTIGRIWNSYAAVGNEHGFSFQVFGSEASIRWDQEDPEHLDLRGWDGKRERLSRGALGSARQRNACWRVSAGVLNPRVLRGRVLSFLAT